MSRMPVLTEEQIANACPGFYATAPQGNVSDRYSFLSTDKINNILVDKGWMPTFARETRSVNPNNRGFNRHVVRWSNKDFDLGDERIELVGVNSHNRRSTFKFMAGIFRLVCENGLITQTADFGTFSIRHVGDIFGQVNDVIGKVSDIAGNISDRMNDYKVIDLTPDEQGIYAMAAHQFVYSPLSDAQKEPELKIAPVQGAPIESSQLLEAHRAADMKSDLWTTFNKVQENLVKGGVQGRTQSGRRMTTRKVTSIGREIQLNQALWTLTEEMAKLKMAA